MMESKKSKSQYLNAALSSFVIGLINLFLTSQFSDEYAKFLVVLGSLVAFSISAFCFYESRKATTPGNQQAGISTPSRLNENPTVFLF
jgi:hypothetical protein